MTSLLLLEDLDPVVGARTHDDVAAVPGVGFVLRQSSGLLPGRALVAVGLDFDDVNGSRQIVGAEHLERSHGRESRHESSVQQPAAPARTRTRNAELRRAIVERVVRRAVVAVLAEVEPELLLALRAAEGELPAGCVRHRGGKAIQHDSCGSVKVSTPRGRFDAASRGRFEREAGRR